MKEESSTPGNTCAANRTCSKVTAKRFVPLFGVVVIVVLSEIAPSRPIDPESAAAAR